MPELRRSLELFRAATSCPDPDAADLKPFKPYVYRGQGYDIFEPEPDEWALEHGWAREAVSGGDD